MNKPNPNTIKVFLIIPCYNEELRLKTELFIQFEKNNPNIHFLFVDDGSKDSTSSIIKELCSKMKNSTFLILNKNLGKGEAIRNGVLTQKDSLMDYEFIGYLDADLSTPLEEINNFLAVIQRNQNIKFIIGARFSRLGANVSRKKRRHYLGRIFATIVSILIKEPIYDSQCGAKLINTSYAPQLFKDKFKSKWLFDVELIIRWKIYFSNYNKIILEHPLTKWDDISGSKLRLQDFLYAPIELFSIWFKYHKYLKNDLPTKNKRHLKNT